MNLSSRQRIQLDATAATSVAELKRQTAATIGDDGHSRARGAVLLRAQARGFADGRRLHVQPAGRDADSFVASSVKHEEQMKANVACARMAGVLTQNEATGVRENCAGVKAQNSYALRAKS